VTTRVRVMSETRRPFKPDLYVVARMIEKLLQSKDGMLKRTQLQMRAGLNWNVFSKYLELMLSRQLVSIVTKGDGEYVALTQRGMKVYRSLIDSIGSILGEYWMDVGKRR